MQVDRVLTLRPKALRQVPHHVVFLQREPRVTRGTREKMARFGRWKKDLPGVPLEKNGKVFPSLPQTSRSLFSNAEYDEEDKEADVVGTPEPSRARPSRGHGTEPSAPA